jgi:ankyrin repeat protein
MKTLLSLGLVVALAGLVGCSPSPDKRLLRAAFDGDVAATSEALNAGAKSGARGSGGITPLAVAAFCGHDSVVQALLQRGADYDLPTNAGDTPLMIASAWGHPSVVKLLVRAGASLNATNRSGKTALIQSLQINNATALRDIKREFKVPRNIGYGRGTPDPTEVVGILLAHGADPNKQDSDGQSALMAAFSEPLAKDNVDLIQILLKAHANPNLRDRAGRTVLDLAIKYKGDPTVDAIIAVLRQAIDREKHSE